jgi:hypothetical protein
MGIDMLDITFRLEKTFGRKRFRPLPSTEGSLWTVGDLFEQVWHALQGKEPAWEPNERYWEVVLQGHALRREAKAALATFHQGWRIFMPRDLNRLIPASERQEVWNRLEAIFGVTMPALERQNNQVDVVFPLQRQTCSKLIDLFERKWWLEVRPEFNQWRPSLDPSPANADQWTRETAWQAFAEILRDVLQVDLEDVTVESTLFGDLGLA